MVKAIGSEFNLPITHLFWSKKNDLPSSGGVHLFSSGRCAIHSIIEFLGIIDGDEVLLPEYLCPEILGPFFEKGIGIKFYRIKKNLRVDLKDFKKKITKRTKLALVIPYFGFQQNIGVMHSICNAKNICLIEDCAQSLLTYTGQNKRGDIFFTSLRKWMPITDGAILYDKTKKLRPNYVKSFGYKWHVLKRYLLLNARSIIGYTFYKSFKNLDGLRYRKPAKMSNISKFIYKRTDLQYIRDKRRENFAYLLRNVKNKNIKPVFRYLPKNVCPLGFPVLTDKRDELKNILIENKIYPPIHWKFKRDMRNKISIDARNLSDTILTIPIDQRYNLKDMSRIEKILNNYGIRN